MNTFAHRQFPSTLQDAAIAQRTYEVLSPYGGINRPLKLRVRDSEREQTIDLPAGAVDLLVRVLEAMAAGRGVTLIPESAELTTVQAADVLNVSRPFLIKLLDRKVMPHRKVGKHRRIRVEDVMAYKNAIDREREQVLEQLTREAQTGDMGYGSR
ncbi:MAG: excisionase family DNA-binding protein [Gammaproteobacteria bacterium]|nr:excisionase family DNA-binding protein [Gammaproteobacteria bacterium]